MIHQTAPVLGVNLLIADMPETLNLLASNYDAWRGEYICVANVHTTVMAHDDPTYLAIQNGAILTLPDGAPLSAVLRKKGISNARRITGPDLMSALLERSANGCYSHFFYGSSEETCAALRERLRKKYPSLRIAGMVSPPYRQLTPEEDAAYVAQINEAQPDFVWIGLGAPKQEKWMAAHQGRLNALMIGVGAAFDFHAGTVKRAPLWVQRIGMEWFYRLIQEPKRLFSRYVRTNTRFLWLLVRGEKA